MNVPSATQIFSWSGEGEPAPLVPAVLIAAEIDLGNLAIAPGPRVHQGAESLHHSRVKFPSQKRERSTRVSESSVVRPRNTPGVRRSNKNPMQYYSRLSRTYYHTLL